MNRKALYDKGLEMIYFRGIPDEGLKALKNREGSTFSYSIKKLALLQVRRA